MTHALMIYYTLLFTQPKQHVIEIIYGRGKFVGNFNMGTPQAQGLVTIHVNILSMHIHVQGRTPFLPPLASSRVCFFNSF